MLEEYDSEDSNPLDRLIRDWIARHEGTPEPPPATAPSIAFYLRRSSADPLYFSIGAQLNACMAHAQSLGVSLRRGRAVAIFDEVVQAVRRWPEFAAEAGVSDFHREQVAKSLRLALPDK